jgi:hypothetical protein
MKTLTIESSAATRIGALVRLLSSDKAGEVLASARAINRTLESAGADIHHLADVVEHGLTHPTLAPPTPPEEEGDYEDVPAMLHYCVLYIDRLDGREADFIRSMRRYQARFRADFQPSQKQVNWLLSIYYRLREAA